MTRGDVFLASVGGKSRPGLVVTRPEVSDVGTKVTVAEITTTARGLEVEVVLDADQTGLKVDSVVNCDGLHTINKGQLTAQIGSVDLVTLEQVCEAVVVAVGC